MYHGNSALQRQRITEWHQQGSSHGGKHQAVGLMAKVGFFVTVEEKTPQRNKKKKSSRFFCSAEIRTEHLLLCGIAV